MDLSEKQRTIGLCATCRFLREQQTRRGATFYRCGRSEIDDRFPQYPPIPVLRCGGHEAERPPA